MPVGVGQPTMLHRRPDGRRHGGVTPPFRVKVPRYSPQYRHDYLSHYTKSPETIAKILSSGLVKPQCDRPFLKHLGFPPFYERLGIACLTEIPVETSALHRNGCGAIDGFGNFGIAFKRMWAERRNFQPVIYVPPSGPIYEIIAGELCKFRERVDANLGSAAQSKIASGNSRTDYFLLAYKALMAPTPARMLIQFAEFDDIRHEMEWRSVLSFVPYEDGDKTQQIKTAAEPTSPETHGWLHYANTDQEPRDDDPYGLLQEGQVLTFSENDVAFFMCPEEKQEALRAELPAAYEQHEIRHYTD